MSGRPHAVCVKDRRPCGDADCSAQFYEPARLPGYVVSGPDDEGWWTATPSEDDDAAVAADAPAPG